MQFIKITLLLLFVILLEQGPFIFTMLANLANLQSKRRQVTKIQINSARVYHLICMTRICLLAKRRAVALTG